MKAKKTIFLLAVSIFCFSAVKAQTEDTLVMYQRDSAIVPPTEQTVLFFQENERLNAGSIGKTILITKSRKTIKLAAFLKGLSMEYPDHVLADLDKDGKNELVIYNFTGGAHCCDEIYIYKNIAPNKYQHVVKLFGGHTVITKEKAFEFSFDETFGYFFTCYACSYTDTSDAAPISLRSILLRYNKGKISVVPGDQELRSIIYDNLGKLGELPFEQPDEAGMDEGIRKEIAMNLVVYYYSFGRNLALTQQLFNKYYKHPDAKKVWAAFTKNLLYIKKESDF
jgi:hypothetical protein